MFSPDLSECLRLAPSPQSGIILYFAYQHRDSHPVKMFGPGCAALPIGEWLRLTSMTYDAFKYSVRQLIALDLVERRFWRSENCVVLRPKLEGKIPQQSVAQTSSDQTAAA